MAVRRRLAQGYSIHVAYAYSKAIDDAKTSVPADQWTAQNPLDRAGSRSLGDYDVRQRLVASWLWEIPIMRDQKGLAGKVLGGWNFAGIATFQDGQPFTIASGRDNSLRGVNKDRPDVLGNPVLSTDRTKSEWLARYFDTSMFVMNALGQYGNAGRNILTRPGEANFDLSLQKRVTVTERTNVELRWELFNAFNRAAFGAPGSNLASASSLGRITTAGPGRIMQFALRFEF
jgi:hypothetical protein